MCEILGVGAGAGAGALLFMTVGCQNPGTEDAEGKDTTDKRSPVVRVGVTRGGRPKLRVRMPRKRKENPTPSNTAPTTAPKPATAPTAPTPKPANSTAKCEVKGNINSKGDKLYHTANGCRDYKKTRINKEGERCFGSEAEARAAGWRKAGSCE